jgi:hypothetical protein
MNKIVVFSYKRDSLPHSEYQVRKQLEKFLVDDSCSFVITTSTASIFLVVRAFCHKNSIRLSASYEGIELSLDKNMGMSNWSNCPDLSAEDYDYSVLFGL